MRTGSMELEEAMIPRVETQTSVRGEGVRVSLYLERDLINRAKQYAASEDRSLSYTIREALTTALAIKDAQKGEPLAS